MPETEGFDMSSLASILQNEDTMRSLRQMAGAMGMGEQLEGALQNLSQTSSADSPAPAAVQRQENHPPSRPQDFTAAPENTSGMNLNSLLSNPALLRTLSSVMQAMNQQGPEYLFLKSLKPLLRPEKGPRVDQAMQIMQMIKALESVDGSGLSALTGLLGGHS